ncbi:hypothetical protein D3C71_827890 [compost metagenome]
MRVLLIGGCLGLGSLVAQALIERGIEVVEDDGSYREYQNPHFVTAEQIGLLPRQFDAGLVHSDLWRDRAVVVWYDLPDNSVHHRTAGPRLAAETPLTHARGACQS